MRRTLAALAGQDLARREWEVLVVDNASPKPVSDLVPPSLEARVIVEPELGLTFARRAGIAGSSGNIVVFVDDDNLLSETYLSTVSRIATEHPNLGVWGGQQVAEWEVPPEPNLLPYVSTLGIRSLSEDVWSRVPFDWRAAPFGAGMCVRQEAADAWVAALDADNSRAQLGVRGAGLARGEDLDLVFTAVEHGWESGLFHELVLTHLMPAERSSKAHLRRLAWHNGHSGVVLERLHGVPAGRAYGRAELVRLVTVLGEPSLAGMQIKFADWRGRQSALAT